MEKTGWEYYELEKEMKGASISRLTGLFKRESEKLKNKCVEYIKVAAENKSEIEKEAIFLDGCRTKIAIRIAEKLTE